MEKVTILFPKYASVPDKTVWSGGSLLRDDWGSEYCCACKNRFSDNDVLFLDHNSGEFVCEACAVKRGIVTQEAIDKYREKKNHRWIKHSGLLTVNAWRDSEGNFNFFRFECRGCLGDDKQFVWRKYLDEQIDNYVNRQKDKSFIELWEEPDNTFDPKAIVIVVNGAIFGSLGYVGREYTQKLREILEVCDKYRIEIADKNRIGHKSVPMEIYWTVGKKREKENKENETYYC